MKHMRKTETFFGNYGRFVYDNRWKLAITVFLINGIFGLGLLSLTLNNDIEDLFLNKETETKQMEDYLTELFPDTSEVHFEQYASTKQPLFVDVIVSGKAKENLFDPRLIRETQNLIDHITNITIVSDYQGTISYKHLCARNLDKCVITGSEIIDILNYDTNSDLSALNITTLKSLYAKERVFSILESLGNTNITADSVVSTQYIKFRFYLRRTTMGLSHDSKKWQKSFTQFMSKFSNNQLDVVYCHSTSVFEELGEETFPDIRYFSLSFTIMIAYLGFYVSGGDCVSKRVNIGRIGTIVVPLSVLGAWGLISGLGLDFTNIVGVIPYFAVYFEVNNMLITLGGVTNNCNRKEARDRISMTLRNSGIPITITTISYVTGFAVGTTSGYIAIKLTSIYTVATLLFIYINHMVFFTACLAIHEERIDANRHFCTCNKVEPRSEIPAFKSRLFRCCCSGEKPTSYKQTSSTIETLSRRVLSRFVFMSCFKWAALFLFLVFLGVSIWKIPSLKIDTIRPDFVSKDSYYSKYENVNHHIFQSNFYMSFIIPGTAPFHDTTYIPNLLKLQEKIIANKYIDPSSLISWIDDFRRTKNDSWFRNSSLAVSITVFLSLNARFKNDFALSDNGHILYSRFYVKSQGIHSISDMRLLKESLLNHDEISDNIGDLKDYIKQEKNTDKSMNPYDIFTALHAPVFVYIDKTYSVLVETLSQISAMIGTNLLLMSLCYPRPLSVVINFASYTSTMLGLFGFMALFQVDLTPITLISSVLGACYIVDVITHTLYSFNHKVGIDRLSRAHSVLSTNSVTFLNTLIASFIGLLVLLAAKSYVFLTVMKILMIATGICSIHAAFILPIALSLFGPKDENLQEDGQHHSVGKIIIGQVLKDDAQKANIPLDFNSFYDEASQRHHADVFSYENKAFKLDSNATEKF